MRVAHESNELKAAVGIVFADDVLHDNGQLKQALAVRGVNKHGVTPVFIILECFIRGRSKWLHAGNKTPEQVLTPNGCFRVKLSTQP